MGKDWAENCGVEEEQTGSKQKWNYPCSSQRQADMKAADYNCLLEETNEVFSGYRTVWFVGSRRRPHGKQGTSPHQKVKARLSALLCLFWYAQQQHMHFRENMGKLTNCTLHSLHVKPLSKMKNVWIMRMINNVREEGEFAMCLQKRTSVIEKTFR